MTLEESTQRERNPIEAVAAITIRTANNLEDVFERDNKSENGLSARTGEMRLKGRVREWREDKGFGFIEPMLPGQSVFVHIKSFSRPGRRPAVGELLTYELGKDSSGRPRAQRVEFSRASETRPPAQQPSRRRPWAIPLAALTLTGIAAGWFVGKVSIWVPSVYAGMSLAAYVLYGWDKVSARGGRWRTKESTLLLAGLLGGWPGALIAQESMRHKTAKASFQTMFWATVILNIVAACWGLLTDFSALRVL